MNKLLFSCLVVLVGVCAAGVVEARERDYEFEEVGAWHLHTFLFEIKESSVDEALSLRKTLRALINNGTLDECSLNQV